MHPEIQLSSSHLNKKNDLLSNKIRKISHQKKKMKKSDLLSIKIRKFSHQKKKKRKKNDSHDDPLDYGSLRTDDPKAKAAADAVIKEYNLKNPDFCVCLTKILRAGYALVPIRKWQYQLNLQVQEINKRADLEQLLTFPIQTRVCLGTLKVVSILLERSNPARHHLSWSKLGDIRSTKRGEFMFFYKLLL